MAKLTLAQAAAQWIKAKRAERKIAAELKAAAEVLKDHFRSSGKHTYNDQISYAVTTRTTLDTDKVKAHLGARLPQYQRTVEVETLSLLA
jgi:hypothetical protein